MPVVSADDLTQRQRASNIVRVAGWTSSQVHHPFGEWACKQGYKTIVTLSYDFAFGHEVTGGFVNTYTDAGCKVLEQLWNPINEQDFSPYLARIQALKPDAVFVAQSGGCDLGGALCGGEGESGDAGVCEGVYGGVWGHSELLRGGDVYGGAMADAGDGGGAGERGGSEGLFGGGAEGGVEGFAVWAGAVG
jgi:hypothetical protein